MPLYWAVVLCFAYRARHNLHMAIVQDTVHHIARLYTQSRDTERRRRVNIVLERHGAIPTSYPYLVLRQEIAVQMPLATASTSLGQNP